MLAGVTSPDQHGGFYALSRKNHFLEKKKGKPLSLEFLTGFLTI
jgi:hypothetical protein